MLRRRDGGFTIVEVVIALLILSVAVLGMGSSAARLTTTASNAELRALALESVEDRLTRISLDPRYGALDSLYATVEQDILGIAGINRTTTILRVQTTVPPIDYKWITVSVEGAPLTEAVVRHTIKAAS